MRGCGGAAIATSEKRQSVRASLGTRHTLHAQHAVVSHREGAGEEVIGMTSPARQKATVRVAAPRVSRIVSSRKS